MNALFLKDLALKIRRGLEGRVRQGRSGGGLCYGYDVVRKLDAPGEPVHGGREINEAEAAIVRRIFADVRRRPLAPDDRDQSQPRRYPGPQAASLGAVDHLRQLAARHRHSQQRALHRPAGLEPPALRQGSQHRQARWRGSIRQRDWVIEEVPELRIIDDDLWAGR